MRARLHFIMHRSGELQIWRSMAHYKDTHTDTPERSTSEYIIIESELQID
jgi:hypothetical protein